jgi:hypothetical protein
VAAFQAPGADIPLFLLTSQVGGLGLTLTAADRVIIRRVNPASDNQSVDRAYRIGRSSSTTRRASAASASVVQEPKVFYALERGCCARGWRRACSSSHPRPCCAGPRHPDRRRLRFDPRQLLALRRLDFRRSRRAGHRTLVFSLNGSMTDLLLSSGANPVCLLSMAPQACPR